MNIERLKNIINEIIHELFYIVSSVIGINIICNAISGNAKISLLENAYTFIVYGSNRIIIFIIGLYIILNSCKVVIKEENDKRAKQQYIKEKNNNIQLIINSLDTNAQLIQQMINYLSNKDNKEIINLLKDIDKQLSKRSHK